jgi:cholesterol oxidase
MADKCEAVVIGSGFGGAINGCRLAKKWPGKVIILERGKRYRLGEFPRSPHDLARNFWALRSDLTPRPRHVRKSANRHGGELRGMFDVRNYEHMDVVMCAGLGGGSLIYANVFMIPPDEIFDQRWPASCKKPDLLQYYQVAKDVLGSRPVPLTGDTRRALLKTDVFQQVAVKLNRNSQLVDINVFFGRDPNSPPLEVGVQEKNRFGRVQTSCTYCGECVIGCNYHAKNTVDLNYLHVAETAHHAEIRTECLVESIVPLDQSGQDSPTERGKHGYAVEYVDLTTGVRQRILSNRVIVSAGSLGSTELLLRCKRRSLPALSNALGRSFSGNGDFLAFAVEGPPVDPNRGPTITQRIDFNLFNQFDPNRAFIIEDASYPFLLAWFVEGVKPFSMWLPAVRRLARHVWAQITSGKSPGVLGYAFAEVLSSDISYGTAVLLCMGSDKSNGVMQLDASGQFTIQWPYRDSMPLYDAILEAGKQFQSARNWKHFIPLPSWDWPIRNNVTVHPLGGCILADDAAKGVTSADPKTFGQAFGYEGLYVADGALLPTAVGANPVATISALSELVAEGITGICPDANLL